MIKTTKQISPVSWLGGKRLLRKTIIGKMPQHHCYVEAMCGGAWVLFGKEPSQVEVMNDLDHELINFYKIVKEHPDALKKELSGELVSRELFNQRKEELKGEEIDRIKKAGAFYYVLKCSYGGMRQTFGYSRKEKPHLNLKEVNRIIHDSYERLLRVYIENLEYQELIPRYDSEETLFFFDPPYDTPTSKRYYRSWSKKDYEVFKEYLTGIKGKFIVTINKSPNFMDLFKQFKIEIVETSYSVQKSKPKKVNELLIMNY